MSLLRPSHPYPTRYLNNRLSAGGLLADYDWVAKLFVSSLPRCCDVLDIGSGFGIR